MGEGGAQRAPDEGSLSADERVERYPSPGFISPVRSGKRVRGRFVLAEAKLRKPNELQSRTNVTVEIEGEDKPALVADWLGLIYFA